MGKCMLFVRIFIHALCVGIIKPAAAHALVPVTLNSPFFSFACSWRFPEAQAEQSGTQLNDTNTVGGTTSDSVNIKPEAIPL